MHSTRSRMNQCVRDPRTVDVVLKIVIDGAKRGELHVSKGGVDWWLQSSKRIKHTWSWTNLADVLETGPTPRT